MQASTCATGTVSAMNRRERAGIGKDVAQRAGSLSASFERVCKCAGTRAIREVPSIFRDEALASRAY